jgi:hypothetical protein
VSTPLRRNIALSGVLALLAATVALLLGAPLATAGPFPPCHDGDSCLALPAQVVSDLQAGQAPTELLPCGDAASCWSQFQSVVGGSWPPNQACKPADSPDPQSWFTCLGKQPPPGGGSGGGSGGPPCSDEPSCKALLQSHGIPTGPPCTDQPSCEQLFKSKGAPCWDQASCQALFTGGGSGSKPSGGGSQQHSQPSGTSSSSTTSTSSTTTSQSSTKPAYKKAATKSKAKKRRRCSTKTKGKHRKRPVCAPKHTGKAKTHHSSRRG